MKIPQYFSGRRALLAISMGIGLLLSAENVFAQVTILRPRQDANYGTTWVGTNRHIHSVAQSMYFGDTAESWQALMMSGNVLGFSGQRLTRGMDISEDWDYNFINPATFNPGATGNQTYYYGEFENTATNPTTSSQLATRFNVGSRAGQLLLNEDVIAVGGVQLILYNHNNTVSRYHMNGNSYTDYTWTSLTGGNYDGMLLGDALKFMIGYEEDNTPALYFIDDSDFISAYSLATGTVIASASRQFTFANDAQAYVGNVKLVDIIDGNVEGWSYIGWDLGPILINVDGIVVPEFSRFSAVCAAFAFLFAICARRKRL